MKTIHFLTCLIVSIILAFFGDDPQSAETTKIISAIFLVGAAVLYNMPDKKP